MSVFDSLPPSETPEQFKAQFYAELHKRTRHGMRQKAERGELPGCAPVGYLNVWDGEKKTIAIDPTKAPLVREAFELALEDKLSLRKILKIVTDKGLTSRNGKPLGVSALWGILANPFYIGLITFNGKLLPGDHEPIIKEVVFERVQENIVRRRKRKTPTSDPDGS